MILLGKLVLFFCFGSQYYLERNDPGVDKRGVYDPGGSIPRGLRQTYKSLVVERTLESMTIGTFEAGNARKTMLRIRFCPLTRSGPLYLQFWDPCYPV